MRRQTISRLVLILFITALALSIDLAPGDNWLGRDVSTRLGLDLQGGVQVLLRPREADVDPELMEAAKGTIERRVNGLGLSEALVQSAGTNNERIIVELPGVTDAQRAIESLQGTGSLEFIDPQGVPLAEGTLVCTSQNPRLPADAGLSQPDATSGDGALSPPDSTNGITQTEGLTETGDVTGTEELTETGDITGTEDITATEGLTGTTTTEDGDECPIIYQTVADGSSLDRSALLLTNDSFGNPAVAFRLTGDAATAFQNFTAQNVGRPLTIVLDNRVISSPIIQALLPGEGIITFGSGPANEQRAEADALLNQLRYGALPVPLEVESALEVTATLGQASVNASIIAGVVGLLSVALFMVLYYHLPGLLANIALLIYTAILFAIYRFLPITLTLPGIAGFILSIGLAVDANVLIFARLKEELRTGRSLSLAVENGFRHAWPSIRDSNASTFITSLILFTFGNSFGVSLIKGFALTLMIGVVISLFTAVFVTRTFLRAMVESGWVQSPWLLGAEKPKTEPEPEAMA